MTGEFYHIYNRGVDKRTIFSDTYDMKRFFQSMEEFNVEKAIGSIYENSFLKKNQLGGEASKLVNFVCYCLNQNHYHFVLEQVLDGGIEKFMQKLGTGYTMYFNNKYKRTGSLFQGVFKASHINSNEYLLHVSAYVNLNNRVHKIDNSLSWNSWNEYIGEKPSDFCKKDIILGQFDNKDEYKKFAESSLVDILERKGNEKDVENLLLE
ncbi:MAG: Transposase [Parcubacteria group bacterium GW2011_GWB2_40_8]|nr:MAG: Transposase [Parcubacteria group bacterium GW2011_GWF2_40_10]KKR47968.1 MAG: Transposase [Parcubacteria group bacterium GW2011_GWA2_40_143]KKR60448.1 MAG: Transposase [Parcubacteria group bacterium GW2011_GWC2_40_31]KKR74510.1 MAG: Transposase [Parcubacteria group bacterium GW2011_GWB2_40_8]KKR77581.1 MAG: Transposase [Parcubacteria group bacterium GW2011_GWE2_40_8]KKR82864.1 MAG: Transposase [Parcubacteria group bacterium GW2011_GWD2_40_9]